MKLLLLTTFLFGSIHLKGQYLSGAYVRNNKIQSVVITMTDPNQKTVTQAFYDERGREIKVKDIEYDLINKSVGSMISEWQSFYKDTFLIKETFRSHYSLNNLIDSSLTLYEYNKQPPFELQSKSMTFSKGQKDLEQYYYNKQGLLDSISYLTNDSSYSNGLRYTGDNLFYTTLQPSMTKKYFYLKDNQLSKTYECNNYSGPLPPTDSIGCKQVINYHKNDTLIQYITTWYRKAGKVESKTKQVSNKDRWLVYEEREGGEVLKTKFVKDKHDIITKCTIYTYPPDRKMWTTTITYKYYFHNIQ